MSPLLPRRDSKAIRFPSGDHVGELSNAGPLVTGVAIPPVAGMIQMSALPLRSEPKAMLPPSGDQQGVVSTPGSNAICVAGPPVAETDQISGFSFRCEWQAILLPSGDQHGHLSNSGCVVRRVSSTAGPTRIASGIASVASAHETNQERAVMMESSLASRAIDAGLGSAPEVCGIPAVTVDGSGAPDPDEKALAGNDVGDCCSACARLAGVHAARVGE